MDLETRLCIADLLWRIDTCIFIVNNLEKINYIEYPFDIKDAVFESLVVKMYSIFNSSQNGEISIKNLKVQYQELSFLLDQNEIIIQRIDNNRNQKIAHTQKNGNLSVSEEKLKFFKEIGFQSVVVKKINEKNTYLLYSDYPKDIFLKLLIETKKILKNKIIIGV